MPNVTLTTKQAIAIAESEVADITVFAGSLGAAKTAGLIFWLAMRQSRAGHQALLVRPTYPEINDTLIPAFMEWFPRGAAKVKQSPPPQARLSNGGKVYFRHVQNFAEDLKGMNVASIGIDQGENISQEAVNFLLGRLREVKPGLSRRMFVTINCNGHDHWWRLARKDAQVIIPPEIKYFEDEPNCPFITKGGVYRKEIEVSVRGDIKKVKIALIEATAEENPHLPDDFLARERAIWDEKTIRRLYYLSWEESASLVFSQFDRELHLIPDDFKAPKGYYTAGMDHGVISPTAFYLWNTFWDPDKRVTRDATKDSIHIIGPEYYEANLTIREHTKEIKQQFILLIPFDRQNTLPIYADPTIFEPVREDDKGRNYSDSELYQLHGLTGRWALTPARTRRTGIKVSTLRELLLIDPTRKHLVTEKYGAPRLYSVASNTNLVDEIESLKTKDLKNLVSGVLTEDKFQKSNTHAIDANCYCAMSRPLADMILKPEGAKDYIDLLKKRRASTMVRKNPWAA